MTRFVLIAFALFTSACAADVDANVEDSSEELRASIEDIVTNTERMTAADRNQRIVRTIVREYGPLAKRYNCDITGVLLGFWRERGGTIKGSVLDTRGATTSKLAAQMRSTNDGEGLIYGKTLQSRLNEDNYELHGLYDGRAIDAELVSSHVSPNENEDALQVFADWTPRGTGGFMKGIVAECE